VYTRVYLYFNVVNSDGFYKLSDPPFRRSIRSYISILLLKPHVSVTVTHGVSVVGVAGWPVILTGWPAGR